MGSWRVIGFGLTLIAPVALIAGLQTSPWLVLPPVAAALLVLMAAAFAVDYFGVARRRIGWGGNSYAPSRALWTRVRALEHRFATQKAKGSPRTAWTARTLLIALAECDRLADAGAVVDFLGADAIYTRVGTDPTGDALRAMALAELGRLEEAREISDALDRHRVARRLPVVAYTRARVAFLGGRYNSALRRLDRGLRCRLGRDEIRDMRVLRARVLAATSRHAEAADELTVVVGAGHRRAVELLGERAHHRGDTALAMAARQALGEAAPYR